jgi:(p)ppGpp synthase/HD superfamily hydrolase
MNQQDINDAVAITFAAGFACAAHSGQKRKYTGEDYYTHPKAVSEILFQHGHEDLELLIAAILHDVVEDTHVTLPTIYDSFGGEVAMLVEFVTKTVWPDPQPKRATKKAFEVARLAMAPAKVKTLKLADRLHNMTILRDDPAFAPVFAAETRALLDEALVGGCPVLWAKVDAIVREYQQQNA